MKTKTVTTKQPKSSLLKSLGPGFLLAGAAIGVSHLVQSTRAGADYGFILIWALVLACATKYPFLEFGPRYAAATGNHLIIGYKKLGVFPYWIYILITIGTMFIIQAAVTIVTAGLAEKLFNFGWSPFLWSFIILVFCIALLIIGKYPGLDKSMKIIVTFFNLSNSCCSNYGLWSRNSYKSFKYTFSILMDHRKYWIYNCVYGLDANSNRCLGLALHLD